MRLLEALRVRVKDVELARREIVIREGKGNKYRVTVLPENLSGPLQLQLQKAKALHDKDLDAGFGRVHMPHALGVKYPNADRSWGCNGCFRRPCAPWTRAPTPPRARSWSGATMCIPSRCSVRCVRPPR